MGIIGSLKEIGNVISKTGKGMRSLKMDVCIKVIM